MEVECESCGSTFEKKPSRVENTDHDFCGRDCYYEWKREEWSADSQTKEKVEKTCENCGGGFEVHPYRADSARFCSRECKDDYMAGRTGADAVGWQDAQETYECQNCGDDFKEYPYRNHQKFCSEACYREASKEIFAGESNPVWRGGRVDNYGPNWDEQRQQALERDGYICQGCGLHADEMERSPDVHHKKRLGWFKEEYDTPEWYQKANRLKNLVTLCPSCHMKREWSNDAIQ